MAITERTRQKQFSSCDFCRKSSIRYIVETPSVGSGNNSQCANCKHRKKRCTFECSAQQDPPVTRDNDRMRPTSQTPLPEHPLSPQTSHVIVLNLSTPWAMSNRFAVMGGFTPAIQSLQVQLQYPGSAGGKVRLRLTSFSGASFLPSLNPFVLSGCVRPPSNQEKHKKLKNRLNSARNWHLLQERFKPGILAMVPSSDFQVSLYQKANDSSASSRLMSFWVERMPSIMFATSSKT